ncbi:MAG: magnesium/cobalt transporter CorA [Hyphomicrobiales bacterium]
MSALEQILGRRLHRGRRPPPGTPPGTLIADPESPPPVLTVFAYGPDVLIERENVSVEEIASFDGKAPVLWINVDGLGDVSVIERLGQRFGLHPLALEDVVNVHQRSKVESYPGNLYIVARMISLEARIGSEQLSLFLGDGFLLSFQERRGDCFAPVRERIRQGRPRLRTGGAGYLAYALLDAVVDRYFPVLEEFGERLERLEGELVESPTRAAMRRVHAVKRDLLTLRRSLWPLRETVQALLREETGYFQAETRPYLQDCYDHAVQVIDVLETYRELGSGLLDVYLSSVSNRMNEIMRVLTMFASIFIPLSFIAGLYGMNFNSERSPWNMPELNWPLGYPFALALMALVAGGLLLFFRARGWIGAARERDGEGDGRGARRVDPPPKGDGR